MHFPIISKHFNITAYPFFIYDYIQHFSRILTPFTPNNNTHDSKPTTYGMSGGNHSGIHCVGTSMTLVASSYYIKR